MFYSPIQTMGRPCVGTGKCQIVVPEILSETCFLNDLGVGKEKIWVDIERIISWFYLMIYATF